MVEQVRAEGIVQTPRQRRPVAPITRAMTLRIIRQGFVTADEIALDTLDQNLIEKRKQSHATCIGELVCGMWSRTPETPRERL